MSKTGIQLGTVSLTLVLLLAAAVGYFIFPAGMLSVVGIEATPLSEFLVRTISAALLAMLPGAWSVRRRGKSESEGAILTGLAIYMFASSAVDLHAYLTALVGPAAMPSIIFRCVLGLILAGLARGD